MLKKALDHVYFVALRYVKSNYPSIIKFSSSWSNDLFRVQAIKVMQVKFKPLKKGGNWEIRNQIKMPQIAHQILLSLMQQHIKKSCWNMIEQGK